MSRFSTAFFRLPIAALALVGGVAVAAPAAQARVDPGTQNQIVTVAENQWQDDTHNHEIGGYNCNFFSSYFGAGSSSCSNGWLTEEWCADFARFVWGRAGVSYTGELNAGAYSFYAYGVNHGTWHGGDLNGIAPGDAIVFGLDAGSGYAAHVAIYDGNSLVISGNAGPNDTQVYRQLTSQLSNPAGYTMPA
jgi:hypothetical protein